MQPPASRHDTPRRWALWCALAALALAAVLLLRPKHDAPPAAQREPAAAQERSGYINRARWKLPAAHPAEQAPEPASISGTAYDLTGAPLAGVAVAATTYEVAGNFPTTVASVQSGEDGRFELRVPDGTYDIIGNKEGYGPTLAIVHSGDDVALMLPRSGVVEGHVHNERKEPITRFTVDVIAMAPDSTAAPAPLLSKRFEGPDGAFRLDQVPGFPVLLRVTATDYAPTFSSFVYARAGETHNVDLTLSGGCTLTGTVHDEKGAPLAGVFLDAETRQAAGMVSQSSMDAASQAQSDLDGRFRLERVPPGEILVRGYTGGYATTTASVQVSACGDLAPVDLTMSTGGSIVGVVRESDGKPLAGVRLVASHRSIGFVNAVTDAEGRYRFEQLPPVVLRLELVDKVQRAVAYVGVKEGQEVEQNIALLTKGSGEIRGRITSGGKPLRGIRVQVACNQGENGLDTRYPTTGPDGTYRATELPDGVYMVTVTSVGRATSAHVRGGGVATADLDVAEQPKPVAEQPKPTEDAVAPARFSGN
ncbi:carboxypeptidase regulatory-like domain-containing protein [Sorangium sp. So ce1000]|uniref:carboxypeptidase regulatory-like domain-containing protein n=1 Tax=Sorangium sp. So ce1000 TaxID=3133325 RepID=UPI003F5E56EC